MAFGVGHSGYDGMRGRALTAALPIFAVHRRHKPPQNNSHTTTKGRVLYKRQARTFPPHATTTNTLYRHGTRIALARTIRPPHPTYKPTCD